MWKSKSCDELSLYNQGGQIMPHITTCPSKISYLLTSLNFIQLNRYVEFLNIMIGVENRVMIVLNIIKGMKRGSKYVFNIGVENKVNIFSEKTQENFGMKTWIWSNFLLHTSYLQVWIWILKENHEIGTNTMLQHLQLNRSYSFVLGGFYMYKMKGFNIGNSQSSQKMWSR